MKKKVERTVHECDSCHKDCDYPVTCLNCGAEYCYGCAKNKGKEYSHGVYAQGSGDGFYCSTCNSKLIASGNNEKHCAYRAIERLKVECEAWNIDFNRRKLLAEKRLEESK